jgi:hypothetical protein
MRRIAFTLNRDMFGAMVAVYEVWKAGVCSRFAARLFIQGCPSNVVL